MSLQDDIDVRMGMVMPRTVGAHDALVQGLWQTTHQIKDGFIDAKLVLEMVVSGEGIPEGTDPEAFVKTMAEMWLRRHGDFAERSDRQ